MFCETALCKVKTDYKRRYCDTCCVQKYGKEPKHIVVLPDCVMSIVLDFLTEDMMKPGNPWVVSASSTQSLESFRQYLQFFVPFQNNRLCGLLFYKSLDNDRVQNIPNYLLDMFVSRKTDMDAFSDEFNNSAVLHALRKKREDLLVMFPISWLNECSYVDLTNHLVTQVTCKPMLYLLRNRKSSLARHFKSLTDTQFQLLMASVVQWNSHSLLRKLIQIGVFASQQRCVYALEIVTRVLAPMSHFLTLWHLFFSKTYDEAYHKSILEITIQQSNTAVLQFLTSLKEFS